MFTCSATPYYEIFSSNFGTVVFLVFVTYLFSSSKVPVLAVCLFPIFLSTVIIAFAELSQFVCSSIYSDDYHIREVHFFLSRFIPSITLQSFTAEHCLSSFVLRSIPTTVISLKCTFPVTFYSFHNFLVIHSRACTPITPIHISIIKFSPSTNTHEQISFSSSSRYIKLSQNGQLQYVWVVHCIIYGIKNMMAITQETIILCLCE